ncbi:hypothetical protein [Methylomonas koyamae]|uniref:hypothetical protein n=1 Tax=Methylomonas koyamae TaxID=702114 RepID=UPI0006D05EFA|nr:hypothetical protein [Methylomonas koyamae]
MLDLFIACARPPRPTRWRRALGFRIAVLGLVPALADSAALPDSAPVSSEFYSLQLYGIGFEAAASGPESISTTIPSMPKPSAF